MRYDKIEIAENDGAYQFYVTIQADDITKYNKWYASNRKRFDLVRVNYMCLDIGFGYISIDCHVNGRYELTRLVDYYNHLPWWMRLIL